MSQRLIDLASLAQTVQAIVAVVLFIYAIVVARDIRESIKAWHLDGMKYVRDLIATPEAAEQRKWVYEELGRMSRPLSKETAAKVQAICRDFDGIGLLCRKGLLPAEIVVETYSRNILDMWEHLKPYIDEIRQEKKDPYNYLEFEWLSIEAAKARAAIVEKPPAALLREWTKKRR